MTGSVSETTSLLSGSSRSELLLLELIRSKAIENYYYGTGPKPPGEEGGPEPHLNDTLSLASLVSSLYIPDPNGDDPGVNGPGGPVMRDILTSLGIIRLASRMNNAELGQQMRSVALEQIVAQAQELQRMG